MKLNATEVRIVKAVRAHHRQCLAEKLRLAKKAARRKYMKPVFYNIDEMRVFNEIFRAVLENEQRRSTWKADSSRKDANHIDPMIDEWNEEQTTRYAGVRVRLTAEGYHLVYPGSSSGTGPFPTRVAAQDYFLGGGR